MLRTTTTRAHAAIADLADFATHGAMTGENLERPMTSWDMGRLPREHYASAMAATYVVRSYATPIAWIAEGTWVIPATRYSLTTSRHQSAALYGAALSGIEVTEEVAA